MGEARTWLESRHLGRSPEGAHALACLARLPASAAADVLGDGDALARVSVTLAHRFFIGAVALQSEKPERYGWWSGLLSDGLATESAGRSFVQALLEPEPLMLAALPLPVAEAWGRQALRLATSSGRLGAAYARAFATGLVRCAPDTPHLESRLRAWADAVSKSAAASSWRGELLASHIAETGAELIEIFDEGAIEAWSDLVSRVGSVGRSPHLLAYPAHAKTLAGWMHARLLRRALSSLVVSPQEAERVLYALAEAATSLSEPTFSALLDAIEAATPSQDLTAAIALVPAVAHELHVDDIAFLMEVAARTTAALPSALPPFLRTMGRALEQGGRKGVETWVRVGLEIGERNASAACAHFRLETRTAHKVLSQHTAAVTYDEIEGLVQRYLRMMARRPVRTASGSGIWLRPPLAASDEPLVRLPERVDLFPTVEENHAFYVLSATHAAGRWEYGTFEFRRARYEELGLPADGLDDPTGGDGIVEFLEAFPNPLLAVGLFTMLDGIRIDSRLLADFPGLHSAWDHLSPAYVSRASEAAAERLPEELIEALFLVSVGHVAPGALPPRLARSAGTLRAVQEQLSRDSADVYDSARLTASLYWTLAAATAAYAGEEGEDLAGLIELGGATAIDPLEHLDAGAAQPMPKGADSTNVSGPQDPAVQDLTLAVSAEEEDTSSGGMPLTPEEIRELIEHGVDLRVSSLHGDQTPSLGLYITTLLGKLAGDDADELRRALASDDPGAVRAWLASQRGNRAFFYDEWDYRISDYRRRWCRLTEHEIAGDGGAFFHRIVAKSRDLLDSVRREFRMMRPEQFRKVRGMQHGDDFDLNALVDAQADRRRKKMPSERLYVARLREERDVATLFLLDMSASTDEPLPVSSGADESEPARRVIDVTKETLVVMASVLDDIGDAYAIYGFSGHGRANVEFYRTKSFSERLSSEVKSRLGGIEPKRSTRMGAALRHAAGKMARVSAKARHLILLSDGFPQDYDYGDDRTSNVYGLRDTTAALQELESQGVHTFCITVDPAGHDYLREMCSGTRYAVIEDVEDLPLELPRIYRTVTRL
jgi:nitric oxide reductase NorD protein